MITEENMTTEQTEVTPEKTDETADTETGKTAATETTASTTEKTAASATPASSAAGKKAETKLSEDDLKLAANLLNQDWTTDLPDNLKETGKRFSSKADAVRAINDFRKRESQVRVPGKDAKPEEVAAYKKAIGIPEKPEDYEFPEVDKEAMTEEMKATRAEWSKKFHDLGLPKKTAKELVIAVNEMANRQAAATIEADKVFARQQEEKLRSEWKGEEYDRNLNMANNAIRVIAGKTGVSIEDLKKIETKDGRFLMDRTDMIRIFAAIGHEMDEGQLGPSLTDSEMDTIDDNIRNVRAQISEAQAAGDSKRANKLYQQEQSLLAKRVGNKSIVGSRGRMV
jgi:hypothetical protein